jgi:hypothetical protein
MPLEEARNGLFCFRGRHRLEGVERGPEVFDSDARALTREAGDPAGHGSLGTENPPVEQVKHLVKQLPRSSTIEGNRAPSETAR